MFRSVDVFISFHFHYMFLLLGPEIYTYEVHTSWVKVFSKILSVIVPISIQSELKSNITQQNRLNTYINVTKQNEQSTTKECPFGFSETAMTETIDPLNNINVMNITKGSSSMSVSKKVQIKSSKIVPITITAETTPMMSIRRLW